MKFDRINTAISLFKSAYAPYKREMFLLVVLGFLGGILEGIGVNAIIPLFSFVSGGGEANDFVSNAIRQLFAVLHIPFNLKYLLIFICVLFIIKAFAMVIFNYINVAITSDYEKQTRSFLFRDTLLSKWSYLLKQKIGYLEQVLVTDVTRSASLLRHIIGMIFMATNLIIYLAVAVNISPLITLLTFVIGGILFAFFKPLFYKARMASKQQAEVTKETAHLVNENMIGIKTVKASSREQAVLEKAENRFEKLRETSVRVNLLSSINSSLVEPTGILFIVVLFAISYKLPGFNFASFAVIIYLVQRIFSYLQIAQNRLQTISELAPYLQTAISYSQEALANKEQVSPGEGFTFNESLHFKNISFRYQDTQRDALTDINLTIEKGQMVGIIGPSGAGKTTLVDLMLRLFEGNSGKILIDGRDIRNIDLRTWRDRVSYVSQDIFLLNDTIANNIRFYDNAASLQEIEDAAKIASIDSYIQSLPKKYDTPVGERGLLLSGGQRQRIVLARALLKKPQILILDEATSALDNESENLIQEALTEIKGKITIVIIAHRLSTIKNCDKLIVLENSTKKEEGAAETLLADKTSYFYKVSQIT